MLVLMRNELEEVLLNFDTRTMPPGNYQVRIAVNEILAQHGFKRRVRLGFDASREISIVRSELVDIDRIPQLPRVG